MVLPTPPRNTITLNKKAKKCCEVWKPFKEEFEEEIHIMTAWQVCDKTSRFALLVSCVMTEASGPMNTVEGEQQMPGTIIIEFEIDVHEGIETSAMSV